MEAAQSAQDDEQLALIDALGMLDISHLQIS